MPRAQEEPAPPDSADVDGQASRAVYRAERLRLLAERDPDEGLRRWGGAFDRSLRALDYEACSALLQALKSLGDALPPRGRAMVLHCHANLLQHQHRWPSALRRYEAARTLYEQSNDALSAAQVRSDMGNVFKIRGDLDRAEEHYLAALPAKRAAALPGDLAATLSNLALVATERGHLAAALEYADEARALYESKDLRVGLAQVEINRGGILRALDRLPEAERAYRRAINLLSDAKVRWDLPAAHSGLGQLLRATGRTRAAAEVFEAGLREAVATGDVARQEQALGDLAALAQVRGELDRAQSLLEQAIALCDELGDTSSISTHTLNLGLIAEASDNVEGALAAFERARTLAAEAGSARGEAVALLRLGDLLRAQGDLDAAERRVAAGASLAESIEDRRLHGRFQSTRASIAHQRGHAEEAAHGYAAARAAFEAADDIFRLTQTCLRQASLAGERGDRAAARRFATEALDLAERSGSPHLRLVARLQLGDAERAANSPAAIEHFAHAAAMALEAGREDQARRAVELIAVAVAQLLEKGTQAGSSAATLWRLADDVWKAQGVHETIGRFALRDNVATGEGETS